VSVSAQMIVNLDLQLFY